MENDIRLDEMEVFGGKLRFLIPHDWVEEDVKEDDFLLFHAPNDDSGGFRVSLITVKGVKDLDDKLRQIFQDAKSLTIDAETGNWVDQWERDTQEDGAPIRLYYWKVANAVPPEIVREAVFSYTILADEVNDPERQKTVKLIGLLVRQAGFA